MLYNKQGILAFKSLLYASKIHYLGDFLHKGQSLKKEAEQRRKSIKGWGGVVA